MRRGLLAIAISVFTFTAITATAATFDISADSIKPIELPQQSSKARIVALANGAAEIVAALGARSALVGRDIASTDAELKAIPIVTSGHQVIAEKVIALKPTVVIIDGSTGPATAIAAIKSAKIKVVKINEAWNLTDIFTKVKAVGNAIGLPSNKLITKMKASITGAKTTWKPRVAFLYLRGPSSIYLIGGPGSGADSLINAIGGADVGAQTLKNPFNTLTSEALVKANPDLILVMTKGLQSVGGISGLINLPGVAQTKAGKAKRVLSVDDSLLLSFGPRTPALLTVMAEKIEALK